MRGDWVAEIACKASSIPMTSTRVKAARAAMRRDRFQSFLHPGVALWRKVECGRLRPSPRPT
ncbi:MAG: hypothetical protein BGP06_12325 [Rhizobiales bacterium 65-9]|nr:MAG: hypothetical protein BGP06_12325 [Rhizobiales bacterium 65-9]